MSFYIQISEEEMSEEIVFGDDSYEAAIADGSLTDETRKRASHLGQRGANALLDATRLLRAS